MWGRILGAALLSLVGSAVGSAATLLFFGSMGLLGGDSSGKAQAVSSVIEAAQAADATGDSLDPLHASRMTAFASREVVRGYVRYMGSCADPELRDGTKCQGLWAALIQAMREDLDNDPLRRTDIIAAVWGSGGRRAEDSPTP